MQPIVVLESRQLARQLADDRRRRKIEVIQHEGHDVAPGVHFRLDFAPQPVPAFATAFKRRWREQNKEMRPGADVFEDDALEVAAGDALEVEKRVITVVFQVLEDRQRPGGVGAPVTDEHGFLDAGQVANL
jgi:hypothetical protein